MQLNTNVCFLICVSVSFLCECILGRSLAVDKTAGHTSVTQRDLVDFFFFECLSFVVFFSIAISSSSSSVVAVNVNVTASVWYAYVRVNLAN